jgi:2'-5' RNA ligase
MESKIIGTHRESIGRYFIAIIPPEPIYQTVQQVKEYISQRYHTRAALNSPPHITLHMPFEWKTEKEALLCDALKSFFEQIDDFALGLLNFSCFPPRTIFIDVEPSLELKNLEKELEQFCKRELNLFHARYRDLPFHPHLTVAFRDMTKVTFAEGWNEFKDKKLEGKFKVGNVALLKHNRSLWKPVYYFSLHLN